MRKAADPNPLDFRARTPVLQELVEIARSFHHLTRHSAMDNHVVSCDVLKNSLVGCRLSPFVVFGLKAVDRNTYIDARHCGPALWNWPEGARNKLNENTHLMELGQENFHFFEPHQWSTPHD